MSWIPREWAETVPVADVYERVILMVMANRADPDGEGVWLSAMTIARRAQCDVQTVKDRLKVLRERGVIREGDQRRAAHLPANRRTKVYDLAVPFSYFSRRQMEEVQTFREEHGRRPLTAAMRPELPDPNPRSRRADAGVKRPELADAARAAELARRGVQPFPENASTSGNSQGGLQHPPDVGGAGGSTTPPIKSFNPPLKMPPLAPRGAGGTTSPPRPTRMPPTPP